MGCLQLRKIITLRVVQTFGRGQLYIVEITREAMKGLQITFFLLTFFLSLAGKSYSEETIHITAGEWSPYLSEKLEHNGIVGRILKEARPGKHQKP